MFAFRDTHSMNQIQSHADPVPVAFMWLSFNPSTAMVITLRTSCDCQQDFQSLDRRDSIGGFAFALTSTVISTWMACLLSLQAATRSAAHAAFESRMYDTVWMRHIDDAPR